MIEAANSVKRDEDIQPIGQSVNLCLKPIYA